MATELSKGKTMVVLAIMAACFAILFPKIFLPMLQQQPTNPQHLPGTQDPHVPPALRERDTTGHMRPERPLHLMHPDATMHPALRDKGRVIPPPSRTIEKQAKPGPIPGMRPPMGGGAHIVAPQTGSGGMGILMPIYTIGIVCFFLYTIMKIAFKKPVEESSMTNEPRIKDFHMDPNHRKFLYAEEYCTGVSGIMPEMSVQDYAVLMQQAAELHQRQKHEQEIRRSRSQSPPHIFPDKIEEVMEPIQEQVCAVEKSIEEEVENLPIEEEIAQAEETSATTEPSCGSNKSSGSLKDEEEQALRQALAALKAQKEEEVDQLRRRLEETEQAMERICRQMGSVADRLSPVCVAQLLTSQLDKEDTTEELVDEKPEHEWDSVLAKIEESFRRSSASINKPEEEEQQQPAVYEAQEPEEETDSYGPEEYQSWIKEHPHQAAQLEETTLIRQSSEVKNLEEEIEGWTSASPDPELEEELFQPTTMETEALEENILLDEAKQEECEDKVAEESIKESVIELGNGDVDQIVETQQEYFKESIAEEEVKDDSDRMEETEPERLEQENDKSDAGRIDENVVQTSRDSEIIQDEIECAIDRKEENLPEVGESWYETELNKNSELPTKIESNEIISVMDLSQDKELEEQVLVVQDTENEILLEETSVNQSSQEDITNELDKEEQPIEDAQPFFDKSIRIDSHEEEPECAFDHNDSSLIANSEPEEQLEEVESEVNEMKSEDPIPFFRRASSVPESMAELTEDVRNTMLERNNQRDEDEERNLSPIQQQPAFGSDSGEQEAQLTEDEESVVTCIEQSMDVDWEPSDVEEAHQEEELSVIPVPSELHEESTIENQTELLSSIIDDLLDGEPQTILEQEPMETEESSRVNLQRPEDTRRTPSEERKMTVMGFDAAAAMEDNGMMPPELMPSISKSLAHHQHHHAGGRAELQLDQEHIPSVFLDTYIPPESHLVVSEAECSVSPVDQLMLSGNEMESEEDEFEPSPVVLSGKMVLSVIGMDPLPSDETVEPVPRVSFPPEPYDKKIFLIPSIDPDEIEEEEQITETGNSRPEEEDETVDDSVVTYRPPTPPIRHSRDEPDEEQANEFMTYDELEEVGEAEENVTVSDGQRRLEEAVEEMVESILAESIAGSLKIPSPSTLMNDELEFEQNREEEELEHSLEQVTQNQDNMEEEEEEEEPAISDFTIREDFPEEEDDEEAHQSGGLMTDEEIQRARVEIEEIKKLLADVSSGRIHQFYPTEEELQSGASSVIAELANAAVDGSGMEGAKQTTTGSVSKGSSPDMEEYEVIPSQTAGTSENKNTAT